MRTGIGLKHPITMDQHDLLVRNRVTVDDSDQNLALIFEFDDGAPQERLDAALRRLVRRHSVLRSNFVRAPGGKAHRSVLEGFEIPTESVQCSRKEDWKHLVRTFIAKPFNLGTGPPIKALLVRRMSGVDVLALCLHHIIADGQSLRILAAELHDDYAGLQIDPAIQPRRPLRERDIDSEATPSDFDAVSAEAIAYWRQALSGFSQVERRHIGICRESARTGALSFELSPEVTTALQRLSLRSRSSLTGTLCAGLHDWIRTSTGRRDTLVSVVVSMRDRFGAGQGVGNFLRVVPTRIDHGATPTYSDLTKVVGLSIAAGLKHTVPQRVLRAESKKAGAEGDLLDVFFVHHGSLTEPTGDHVATGMRRRWLPRIGTKHIVELNTVVLNGRLRGDLLFGGEFCNKEDSVELGRSLIRVLEALSESYNRKEQGVH